METFLEEMQAVAKTIPEDERAKVILTYVSPTPDYPDTEAVGQKHFLTDGLALAGVMNAVNDDSDSIIFLSPEEMAAANPDFILSMEPLVYDAIQNILSLSGGENITAIKEKQVYAVDNRNIIGNQHVCTAILKIAQMVYPELYKDFKDPFAE